MGIGAIIPNYLAGKVVLISIPICVRIYSIKKAVHFVAAFFDLGFSDN